MASFLLKSQRIVRIVTSSTIVDPVVELSFAAFPISSNTSLVLVEVALLVIRCKDLEIVKLIVEVVSFILALKPPPTVGKALLSDPVLLVDEPDAERFPCPPEPDEAEDDAEAGKSSAYSHTNRS
jgi:hypothetical protein